MRILSYLRKILDVTHLQSRYHGTATAMIKHPCQVGDSLSQVDTPALLVDLDKLESNLQKLPLTLTSSKSVKIRPHGKAHKCPQLGLLQQSIGGCTGICAQTLSEAEAFVEGGLKDVFISNQVIGLKKLKRVAQLVHNYGASLSLCVDDKENIKEISNAASSLGPDISIGIVVEVNVGQERCGVEPGEPAVDLAKDIFKYNNLKFLGIQCYQGWNQHIRLPKDRKAAVDEVVNKAELTLQCLQQAGIQCPLVTGGGTGTYPFEAASGVFTEIQPGSYALMDVDYNKNFETESDHLSAVFQQSLYVLSTIQSVSGGKRAVVDCGMKGVSLDSGPPQVLGLPSIEYSSGGDEHGILRPEPGLKVGETVLLIPGHCDPTVNLHDWMIGFRGDRVESVWPITGRGPGV